MLNSEHEHLCGIYMDVEEAGMMRGTMAAGRVMKLLLKNRSQSRVFLLACCAALTLRVLRKFESRPPDHYSH